jgi:putative endonuclease
MMDIFKIRKRTKGQLVEKKARDFLQANGLKFITQNYYCRFGEIDLIMIDGDELVFIEVRLRTHLDYGSAIESINYPKQKRLLATATHYLQKHPAHSAMNCRFDVMGFSGNDIDWIKDAFSYEHYNRSY